MLDFQKERTTMVDRQLRARGIIEHQVLAALGKVPREYFVLPEDQDRAYADCALPIGFGQTISQPYMVARTVELLKLKGTAKVLEIGGGSGYQAAVLGELAGKVYSIERIPELVEYAKNNLKKAGYENVEMLAGDGTQGLAEHAPYDVIVVAAAAKRTPEKLKDQLKDGGRIAIPLDEGFNQVLTVVTKQGDRFQEEYFDGCVYVPLIGDY